MKPSELRRERGYNGGTSRGQSGTKHILIDQKVRDMNVVLLGVSGSGKTTVGHALVSRLGWLFADGDDFHSVANKAKMAAGMPLTDADREHWLETIGKIMAQARSAGRHQIVACSALKRRYRDVLRGYDPDAVFVYLKVPRAVLEARLKARQGHFFPPALLSDQLSTLEEPDAAEAITVDASRDVGSVVDAIAARLEI
jgi:gluconokinase